MFVSLTRNLRLLHVSHKHRTLLLHGNTSGDHTSAAGSSNGGVITSISTLRANSSGVCTVTVGTTGTGDGGTVSGKHVHSPPRFFSLQVDTVVLYTSEGVGVMKDKQLKIEETEVSLTLGGLIKYT